MKNIALAAWAILILLLSQAGSIQSQSISTQQRAPVKCMEDSPERRGEEGCSILASRPLVGPVTKPLYWHIDRFDSLEAAKKAAGPNGVAAEAHGSVWLLTVEGKAKDHHGGNHAAWIGPLALPAADGYTMRVMSSLLKPGGSTPVHTHSGPEVFYTVAGTQCLETVKFVKRLGAGQFYVLPGSTIHRGRVEGSVERRLISLVLHDAAQPPSRDLNDDPPTLVPCNGTAQAQIQSKDEETIRRFLLERIESFNRHEGPQAIAYTADADFVNVYGMWRKGPAEIEGRQKERMQTVLKDAKITLIDMRIRFIKPDVAIVHQKHEMAGCGTLRGRQCPHIMS